MNRPLRIACAPAALLLLLVASGARAAYTGGAVSSGGALRGTVRFTGTVPPPELIPTIAQDVAACGDTVASEALLVGASKGVSNAIVTIEGITYGKRIPTHPDSLPRVVGSRCRYQPRVQIATLGDRLSVVNEDDLLHNAHARDGAGETLFNLALPTKGLFVRKDLKTLGLVTIRCDAGHPWMAGYLLVLDHPYGAVTDANGAFSIDGIPPGTYTLRVWHETLGTTTQQVTVRPEETASADFEFSTIPPGALVPLAPALPESSSEN